MIYLSERERIVDEQRDKDLTIDERYFILASVSLSCSSLKFFFYHEDPFLKAERHLTR